MQDKKNIEPRNNKGQRHGYWELYWTDGTLFYNVFYVNNIKLGFSQLYNTKEYYAR